MDMQSKAKKLIEMIQTTPVEWKPLGEVSKISSGGTPKTGISKYYDGDIPWLRTQEVNFNDIWNTEIKITKEGLQNSSAKLIPANCVIIAMYGATVGRVGINKIPLSTNQACANICVNKDILNYRFVFHYLCSQYEYIKSLGTGSQTNINAQIVKNIKIPIPPLEIQAKIVKILDKFTKYATELETELEKRIKQYNHYRDRLLSETYLEKITREMEEDRTLLLTTLGEIGEFTRGNGLQKKDFLDNGNPVIHYGQIYTNYGFYSKKVISYVSDEIFSKLKKAKKNDILIATTSENMEDVGKCVVWLGEEEIGFSGDMYSYRTNQNAKYIAYYFQTNEFQKIKERKVTGTKLSRIHGEDMSKIPIYLPSLDIQNKVVKILDKFQEMLEYTKGLLPQEIELRRKQYEYYREKLLTFDSEYARERERERAW